MPKKKPIKKKTPGKLNPGTSTDRLAKGPAEASPDTTAKKLPIVGLGASAGGLEALKSFFAEVSENSGMAYIVVVHMSPKQPSMLPDLLQKISRIPVSVARGRPAD